jgi:transposase
MTDITIGADISKDHIDLYSLPDGKVLRVANDRKGFVAVVRWIGAGSVERIVYEPTGPYHKAFERFMTTQGLPLSKVNPRSARRFCEATGRLAKTDRIDAALLARYGALLGPGRLAIPLRRQTPPRPPEGRALAEIQARHPAGRGERAC